MSLKPYDVGNRARASAQASFNASVLSFSVYDNASDDDFANLPSGAGNVFVFTIEDERILCYERSSNAVTVYDEDTHSLGYLSAGEDGRGYDGTTPASHDGDVQGALNIGKAELDAIQDAITADETNLATNYYTKTETDILLSTRIWKSPSPRASSFGLGDITLSATQTIDGVALGVDDEVHIGDNTDAKENGIYIVKAGAWVRRDDFDTGEDVAGAAVRVVEGTANSDTTFYVIDEPAVVGTDDINFAAVTTLVKASDADAAAGVDDSKYTTVDKVVHLLGNLASGIATLFVNTRTAKASAVAADALMLMDSADSNNDKKITLPNLRSSLIATKCGSGSRVFSAADGAVTYAHYLGRIPIGVSIDGGYHIGTSLSISNGYWGGSTQSCTARVYISTGSNSETSTTYSIRVFEADSGKYATGVITVDATNITITWTKTGGVSGATFQFNWKVLG